MVGLTKMPLRIAFVTSEINPYSKSGGLASVSRGLPIALKNRGHDVRIISPFYRTAKQQVRQNPTHDIAVPLGDGSIKVQIIETFLPGTNVPIILIKYDPYFDRPKLYGEDGQDYSDNSQRFALLCRATLEALKAVGFQSDILHANDWQTGLIPPMLQSIYQNDPHFSGTATVYTTHNLEFLGLFGRESLSLAQLGTEHFTHECLEFFGQASYAKGGLAYAHKINTVSPTYRNETLTKSSGCGLHDLLSHRKEDYVGILNGIDYSNRNPGDDTHLPLNYSPDDLLGKEVCKEQVQRDFILPTNQEVPLLGFVGRLTNQKGLDLIKAIFKDLMQHPLQIVFLGTGEPEYYRFLNEARASFPNKVGTSLNYSEERSHRVYAGSDIFLMPSRVEPCGLAQMIAMRYGTPPIVMKTGGLADTVVDFCTEETGNGFVFTKFTQKAFMDKVICALGVFKDKPQWRLLQRNAMSANFSWETSAEAYENLYISALKKARGE